MARRTKVTPEQQQQALLLLRESKMSQQEIAMAIGVSQAYISNLSRGLVPTIESVAHLPQSHLRASDSEIQEALRFIDNLGEGWRERVKGLCEMFGYEVPTTKGEAAELIVSHLARRKVELKMQYEKERYEREYPRDRSLKPTLEENERRRMAEAEQRRRYQEEMPEIEMVSEKLMEWSSLLEYLGSSHALVKKYIMAPKEQLPVMQLAIRYALDPRGPSIKEMLKKEMHDNLMKQVASFEVLINGSASWREYAANVFSGRRPEVAPLDNNPLIITRDAQREEVVDPALEEFMRNVEPSRDVDKV